MAATWVQFEQFPLDLGSKLHNLTAAGDVIKVYLTNNTPDVVNDSVQADLVGITEENGYAAADILNTWTSSAGVASLVGTDVVLTASGGDFGPFRYVVVWNSTADLLIAYYDYGSSISVINGYPFTVDFGANIFTLGLAP